MVVRAKKYRKSMPMSTHSLSPCSNGSSMPRPMDRPPASATPLFAASMTPGQHDERLGGPDEHGRAGEEVSKVDADVDPLVEPLLERQLDAQADGQAAGLGDALVRRL